MWGDFLSVRQKIWIKALYSQIVRDTRIISSTWTKEGCKKGIYYTTQVTYWNLLRITTANAIIRYHIFHLFVGRHKKGIPVMERYCRLNIKIEGHITNLYYLFWHFKNMLPFLLALISLYKNIFLSSSCCRMENSLFFHGRDVDFAEVIVLLAWWSIYDTIMSYTLQQLECDIRV